MSESIKSKLEDILKDPMTQHPVFGRLIQELTKTGRPETLAGAAVLTAAGLAIGAGVTVIRRLILKE